uniref:Secreted protein n=1 Tax=Rhodosorus marinus TaxID=101924 RepID=A0A7S0BSI0_9RHOD|mmetsp:Transcript_6949/g.10262  ORF Transcript_6949/g.10262 Transcript_6949/m.10262 type:complete len:214 (+) Transcript_6949:238-879(+)
MKYGLVVILLAGTCAWAVGDRTTCADFFNPIVNEFTSLPSCYPLEVEGEPVGIIKNNDVSKRQGPNKGETCVRFTIIVRDGLGIRRAKVGLWFQVLAIPLSNVRFTRKRKFLDTEPTRVRVDVCLDDIPTGSDCCTGENIIGLVAEAKVRMENGKVATAGLPSNIQPGSLESCVSEQQLQCGQRANFPSPNTINFCQFQVRCDNSGGEQGAIE